jgi:hypothetical protein
MVFNMNKINYYTFFISLTCNYGNHMCDYGSHRIYISFANVYMTKIVEGDLTCHYTS